ncbi:hypothetical protein BDZ45DRAFT_618648 [Acephala macrosclerotiorum]|nr:hypothetical protein BDZ45DRAFT_618648 [Acephala macrosclerotiorum]
MAAATDNADREALLYQINHVFLPPELPQKDDTNAFNEKVLMETVISGLKLFRTYFPMNQTYQLDHSIRMMHCMISMRDKNGFLDPIILDEKMRRLSDFDSIPIHLRNQNSGLLITKVGSEFRFESLELLARDKDVMGCKGRLKRRFPDASVALHDRHIKDGRFRKPFIELLVKLDREQSPKHQTRLETAIYDNTDATSGEEIDTTDPQLVTGMVMAMLWGIGRIIDSLRICKHSREEVLLYDGLLPWRRSPLWLLIRVSLQLTMERLGEIFVANNKPGSLYKDLMAFLMSYILRNATYRGIPHDLLFAMTAKISRRMFKLQLSEEVPWLSYTENATRDVELMLRQTWDSIELTVQNRWDLSALHSLDFDVDTMLSLDSLQPYLEQITLRDHCTENSKIEDTRGHAFQRNEDHRRPIGTFNKDHEFRYFELADFEHSVEYYLESFTATSNEPATSEFPDEESTKLDIPDLESDTLESFLNQCDSKVVENTTMPVFSYGPLQQDEVRVIKIKQGDFDDPIVCDLEHVALSTAPEFHALSYVWGDTSVKFPIQINGHSFQITKNLHTGMRQIRKKYADIGNFNLWIDAIRVADISARRSAG